MTDQILEPCPCGSARAFIACHGQIKSASIPDLGMKGGPNQTNVAEIAENMNGLGFQRIETLAGSTFRDSSTIIIVPERNPLFHHRVVQCWQNLIAPMNQKRAFLFCIGDEVGVAYTNLIKYILADPQLSTWKYIMTLESDNLVPPDAHVRLLESIEAGRFDAVSGLYWTKGEINMPMCYGDAAEYAQTGVLDFKPLNVYEAVKRSWVVECNGIAMGCALWRLDMFRELEAPWYVTVNDIVPGKGAQGFTQDLYFCQRAKQAGKRFAVDMRVRVGHFDLVNGIVY